MRNIEGFGGFPGQCERNMLHIVLRMPRRPNPQKAWDVAVLRIRGCSEMPGRGVSATGRRIRIPPAGTSSGAHGIQCRTGQSSYDVRLKQRE